MNALRKVLVVDDDPVVGKSFDRVLSGKGYAVITAKDGAEALQKLSTGTYDLVYTDIRMPGMSGLEVAERVKAERPWTPVVIITGYGNAEHEARAKAAGVSSFLHKPLSPEIIEGSARAALAVVAPEPKAADVALPAAVADDTVEKDIAGIALAAKNIALFFAAPFVALAYIVIFPFMGLAMFAWYAAEAAARTGLVRRAATIGKHVALFFAAPFIGLAYILAFPFIGIGMLAYFAGGALGEYAWARKVGAVAKGLGMVVAIPVVTLGYAVLFPFVALGALAFIGAQSLVRRPVAE